MVWVLGIAELHVQPYDEDEGVGDLRYVQVNIYSIQFNSVVAELMSQFEIFILYMLIVVQMAVTTYNTSLPAAERYKNGDFIQ